MEAFTEYVEKQLDKVEKSLCRADLRDILLRIYGNPVVSREKLMEERKKIARKESDKKKQERAKVQATFKEHETKLRRLNSTRNVLKPKAPISARKPSGMKKPRSIGK